MQIVKYFKALSDETRLRLLHLLCNHELNVNEIVSLMEMGQSRISRHLKILMECGLLTSRRDGLWIFYSASGEGRGCELISIMDEFIGTDPEIKEDYIKLAAKLEKGLQKKRQYFDSIASDWDNIKHEIFGSININEEILSRLPACDVASDLGCGTGELLPGLREKAARVVGVDNSPKMLEEAEKRLGGIKNGYELRIGSIEHLPMRDSESDTAVINMVLHHLPSPRDGIIEAGRVIKKGGTLLIVDLEKHSNEEMRKKYDHRWLGFDKRTIKSWLSEGGFAESDYTSFKVDHGLKVSVYEARKG